MCVPGWSFCVDNGKVPPIFSEFVPTDTEPFLASRTNLSTLIPIAESWISIAVLTDGEFPSPSLVW